MEILNAFGIDLKLLIANLVNFLILVGVLYKFAYQPVLKFVHDRQKTIDQGITDAKKAAEKLEKAQHRHEAVLAEAHKEAQEILTRAKEQSEIQGQAMLKKTNNEAKAIVERAKKDIRLEREQSVAAAKNEISAVVIEATERILKAKLDAEHDKKMIKTIIASL